jgi:hypothetical protein
MLPTLGPDGPAFSRLGPGCLGMTGSFRCPHLCDNWPPSTCA